MAADFDLQNFFGGLVGTQTAADVFSLRLHNIFLQPSDRALEDPYDRLQEELENIIDDFAWGHVSGEGDSDVEKMDFWGAASADMQLGGARFVVGALRMLGMMYQHAYDQTPDLRPQLHSNVLHNVNNVLGFLFHLAAMDQSTAKGNIFALGHGIDPRTRPELSRLEAADVEFEHALTALQASQGPDGQLEVTFPHPVSRSQADGPICPAVSIRVERWQRGAGHSALRQYMGIVGEVVVDTIFARQFPIVPDAAAAAP